MGKIFFFQLCSNRKSIKRLKVEYVCVFVCFFEFHFCFGFIILCIRVHHDTVLTHLFHDGRYNLLTFYSKRLCFIAFKNDFSQRFLSLHSSFFLILLSYFPLIAVPFSGLVKQLIARYVENNNVTHFMR